MATANVASSQEHLVARLALLEKEKQWMRLKDSIAEERRNLPLVEITKDYTFVDADSSKTVALAEVFQGRRQLIVYHAMFDPSWESACSSCTLLLDHIPPLEHIHSHNTSLAVVSLAPVEKIAAYKSRLAFNRFPWYSSHGTSFNADFGVTVTTPVPGEEGKEANDNKAAPTGGAQNDSYNFRSSKEHLAKNMSFFANGEQPGHSVFVRGGSVESGGVGKGEEGKIYHSYSGYARAGEVILGTLQWLDMTPLGRQDRSLDGAAGLGYRRRDEYTKDDLGGGPASE